MNEIIDVSVVDKLQLKLTAEIIHISVADKQWLKLLIFLWLTNYG